MAASSIVQTASIFDLCIHVHEVANFWSSDFIIQAIPWNIHIRKVLRDNEDWLGVYLNCKKNDAPPDWAIAATLTVRLVSAHGDLYTIENSFEPGYFDHNSTGYGTAKFIKWNELFDAAKNYVKDDMVNFNMKVEVADQNTRNASKLLVNFNKCCDDSRQVTLGLVVQNVDNLMAVRTSEFNLQNVRWNLLIFQHSNWGLGLRIQNKDVTNETTRNVNIDLKIPSATPGVQDIEQSWNRRVPPSPNHCSSMYPNILWIELFKPENGFVINNNISFDIKIKVDKLEEAGPNPKKRRATNSSEATANGLELECAICLDEVKNLTSTVCGHVFCSSCITKTIQTRKRCPTCNTELNMDKIHPLYLPM